MVYFRKAQTAKCKVTKLFYEYKLFRLCRRYGIEIKTSTKIGEGFVMCHPYNITISPYAVLGKNINIMKGATIGLSGGKKARCPSFG